MFVDRVRFCEQTIRRHKRRYSRKQGEQPVEDDACRNGEKPVFGRLVRCSPKNVFPAFPWDFDRKRSVAASARFLRTLKLQSHGFLATLRGTKRLFGFGLFGPVSLVRTPRTAAAVMIMTDFTNEEEGSNGNPDLRNDVPTACHLSVLTRQPAPELHRTDFLCGFRGEVSAVTGHRRSLAGPSQRFG